MNKRLYILTSLLIGNGLALNAPPVNAGVYDANFGLETEHFIVSYEFEATKDLAEQTAAELEDVIWKKEIETLGFKSPLRYEGDKFRVYIDDNNEEIKHPRVLGITVATSDGEIYIAMSENIEEWDTYANTLTHEFFHVIQYRYLSPEGDSFKAAPSSSFESGAIWIESEVYPELDEYASYMDVFLDQPNGSIFLGERPGLSYWEYALGIWVEWIEEKTGPHVIDNFWRELYAFSTQGEDITQSFMPYLSYSRVISWENHSLLELFHKFTIANINTDQFYEIGENLNDATVSGSYSSYPVNNDDSNSISLFGSKYYKFTPKSETGNLKFTVHSGDTNMGILVSLVPINENGEVMEAQIVKQLFNVGASEGSVFVKDAQQYEQIMAIVSPVNYKWDALNVNEEIFYIDKTFTFEADWTSEYSDPEVINKIEIPSSSPYSDLSTTHKNYKAITYLSEKEVLEGYSDGTFKPENSINRAEFLKILVASLNVDLDPEKYQDCYPDVKDEWYAKYICYGTENGWVEGYPDSTFQPEETINKVEALKMLLESRGISTDDLSLLIYDRISYTDTPNSEWYYPYLQIAYGLKILEENGTTFNPDGLRTRAEVSEETFRLTSLKEAQTVTPYTSFYSTRVDEIIIDK